MPAAPGEDVPPVLVSFAKGLHISAEIFAEDELGVALIVSSAELREAAESFEADIPPVGTSLMVVSPLGIALSSLDAVGPAPARNGHAQRILLCAPLGEWSDQLTADPRAQLNVSGKICFPQEEHSELWHDAHFADISVSGVAVDVEEPVPVGVTAMLAFEVGEASHPHRFRLPAQVVRVEPNSSGVRLGCVLRRLTVEQLTVLGAIVAVLPAAEEEEPDEGPLVY